MADLVAFPETKFAVRMPHQGRNSPSYNNRLKVHTTLLHLPFKTNKFRVVPAVAAVLRLHLPITPRHLSSNL